MVGLTETSTVVCATLPDDIVLGSSGYLLPGFEARLISPDGKEITEYDTPGELVVRSPSVVLGYLNNVKATEETFKDGWMYTGDEAVIRPSPKTNFEHVWIVDRIKELIKVKVFTSSFLLQTMLQVLTVTIRVYKLLPPSLNHIFSSTRPSMTVPLSPYPTIAPVRCLKRSSSSLQALAMMRQRPKQSASMLKITRLVISG